jgi:hypothetical protein
MLAHLAAPAQWYTSIGQPLSSSEHTFAWPRVQAHLAAPAQSPTPSVAGLAAFPCGLQTAPGRHCQAYPAATTSQSIGDKGIPSCVCPGQVVAGATAASNAAGAAAAVTVAALLRLVANIDEYPQTTARMHKIHRPAPATLCLCLNPCFGLPRGCLSWCYGRSQCSWRCC